MAGAEKVKDETYHLYNTKFRGLKLLEGYGATEAAPVVAVNHPDHNRPGTVGQMMPGMEWRIDPVDGIPDGGRLFLRGPNVMRGYLSADDPESVDPLPGGWHDTGDIVDIDKDGYVSILGRIKRFAKIGGEMVPHGTVEQKIVEAFGWDQLETIAAFRPAVALWMNFAPDHLDRHPSLDAYFDAKARIFENQTDGDTAIVKLEDRRPATPPERTVTFSAHSEGADYGLVGGWITFKGERVLDFGSTRLRGRHNAENLMAALVRLRRLVLAASAGAVLPSVAPAMPLLAREYKQEYGYMPSCNACHSDGGGSTLNAYGKAFKAAGKNAGAFARIANLDSDGDGASNGSEAAAKANPGDPRSTPAKPGEWLDIASLIPREVRAQFPGVRTWLPRDALLTPADMTAAKALGVTLNKDDENTIYIPLESQRPAGTARDSTGPRPSQQRQETHEHHPQVHRPWRRAGLLGAGVAAAVEGTADDGGGRGGGAVAGVGDYAHQSFIAFGGCIVGNRHTHGFVGLACRKGEGLVHCGVIAACGSCSPTS